MSESISLSCAAHAYASRGLFVFPLFPGTKIPLTENGHLNATTDASTIDKWWAEHPEANIGIAVAMSGLVIPDLDIDHADGANGYDSYRALPGYEVSLPVLPKASTARKGGHLYYKAPVLQNGQRIVAKLAPGIDVKYNGYVVAPPSIVDGKAYEWMPESSVLDVEPPPVPLWLVPLLVVDGRSNAEQPDREISERDKALALDALKFIPADCARDEWLRIGMGFKAAGGSYDDFRDWSATGEEKFDEAHCEKAWNSFKRSGVTIGTLFYYAKQNGFKFPIGHFALTDVGNAERFITQFGAVTHYLASEKKWLLWDGIRWRRDDTGQVVKRAKETARDILREASECEDDGKRGKLLTWAKTSNSNSGIKAMLELARPDLAVSLGELDTNKYLLNCRNGTINLRTGELSPHCKEDLITKLVPVDYDPRAKAPRFLKFLAETFCDSAGLIEFVQCALGYSLTGSVKEQKLFVCYGEGQNGKSTLFNAVREVLGDYAQETDPELLVTTRTGGATEGVYVLNGIRFATTIETGEDVKLNEVKTKQLTGGDPVTARPLYGHLETFEPSFKLWLITNHLPRVRSQSVAIWRRLLTIPFNAQISEEDKDRNLPEKLRQEYKGILVWLVSGCLMWLKQGLPKPREVEAATTEYKSEEDALERFLDDCCAREATSTVPKTQLHTRYAAWCAQEGEDALSRNKFSKRMVEKGFQEKRTSSASVWGGVALLAEPARFPPLAIARDSA